MTVVRDRKIRTALRTNRTAEFVTVTAWKKKLSESKKVFIRNIILCNFIENQSQQLRVRFFKKSKIGFLNPKESENGLFLRFFTKQINPRSFGSWHVKGTEESISRVVPLRHCDPRDLGLICLVKKCKIRFQILSDLKTPNLDFLKATHSKALSFLYKRTIHHFHLFRYRASLFTHKPTMTTKQHPR